MKVLALDLSLTAIGWARSTELRWETGILKPRGKGVPRLQDALDQIMPIARDRDLVAIEGYSFGSLKSHPHSLGELGGVIKLVLHQKRIPIVIIPPATAKKLATGKGNAGKELVLVEAVKRLEYSGADNNEADALWLLQAALIHYGLPGGLRLPATHMDALRKVEWPAGVERAA